MEVLESQALGTSVFSEATVWQSPHASRGKPEEVEARSCRGVVQPVYVTYTPGISYQQRQ